MSKYEFSLTRIFPYFCIFYAVLFQSCCSCVHKIEAQIMLKHNATNFKYIIQTILTLYWTILPAYTNHPIHLQWLHIWKKRQWRRVHFSKTAGQWPTFSLNTSPQVFSPAFYQYISMKWVVYVGNSDK